MTIHRGVGSGVIVDAKMDTDDNHHVVTAPMRSNGAGRRPTSDNWSAPIPQTDLAVLKSSRRL